jgi:hypothetical protein
VWFAAGFHPGVDAMDSLLRGVGDLHDMLGLSLLTVLKGRADPWFASVMPRGLDQQPAGEAGSGLGDRSLARAFPRLVQ